MSALLAHLIFISYFNYVAGQSGAYGQCGGIGWTGSQTCVSGSVCTFSNSYYSQCLPGTAATSTTASRPASATTSRSGSTTTSRSAATTSSASTSTSTSTGWIVPGAVWYDTSGVRIDAHGGGILHDGGVFYWVGQSDSSGVQPRIYSSTDLVNWKNEGVQYALSGAYRPKLFKIGSKYYIYNQVNRYITPLSSNTVVGGYSEQSSMELPPNDYSYSDQGNFQDSDGTWYFAFSADHDNLQVNVVNKDGTIGSRVSVLGGSYEGPGLFKAGGIYFLIVSSKTGYRDNPNKVFWSTSISGTWNGPADIAPESTNTYNSQNTNELVITGSSQTSYIYMGDSWDTKGDASSTYMWLPMAVNPSSRSVTLQYYSMWKINVNTGIITTSSQGKRYEAESARISGRAAITNCAGCISKRAVHNVDRDSELIFRDIHGTGQDQWVSFHYTVNDQRAGEAHVFLNDETTPRNISEYNLRAGHHESVPIRIYLADGTNNTIRFGCSGSKDFKIHIDGIEVHKD